MAFDATEQGFESLVVEAWPTTPHIATVGSSCLVGVVTDETIYIANCGDSRAVREASFAVQGKLLMCS
ncbi:hypothetical protein KP509_02G058800 [Ceratopteris richardii]|uniref:PPM-type phosphatase domain-containing protein n=1 Tax=Ceratopteris richardii TaxID=49495 RepID=A0A8T2V671_CERRI|nr:hypothetical protein KP509_02G058800 [Ceratopteris richardii]